MHTFLDSFRHLIANAPLIRVMARREVETRYRGSFLGNLWPIINPLLMLLIYTFVFGYVFKARWPGQQQHDMGSFAIQLLSGLLLHGMLAECLGRAPTTVLANPNYVKKVVFPLEILPWVNLLSALFHGAIGFLLLVVVNGVWGSGFHLTLLALPLILLPFSLLLVGLGWIFSALGVYVRDLGQLISFLITLLMFMSPVFYPIASLPMSLQHWLYLNPLTIVVEQMRAALIHGTWPDWSALTGYGLATLGVYVFGFWFFAKCRRGFADVL